MLLFMSQLMCLLNLMHQRDKSLGSPGKLHMQPPERCGGCKQEKGQRSQASVVNV